MGFFIPGYNVGDEATILTVKRLEPRELVEKLFSVPSVISK